MPLLTAMLSLLVIPLNGGVFFVMVSSSPSTTDLWLGLFFALAAVQLGLAVAAIVTGVRARRANGTGSLGPIVIGAVSALAAPVGAVLAFVALAIGGGGA